MVKNEKMTVGTYNSKDAGKAYKLAFRTGIHTDKKKQAKKYACRNKKITF